MAIQGKKKNELKRQLVHASGICVIFIILFFGADTARIAISLIILFLIFLASYRRKIRWIGKEISSYERPGESPMFGAITFFAGCFIATFFQKDIAIASIAVLALADAVSTLIGRKFGKHKLPINTEKSWEGSFAFFLMSLAILWYFVFPAKAVTIALIATIIEGLSLEDNVTIPITVGLLLQFI